MLSIREQKNLKRMALSVKSSAADLVGYASQVLWKHTPFYTPPPPRTRAKRTLKTLNSSPDEAADQPSGEP